MTSSNKKPPTICILALPESSGVVLYGLLEVLSTFSCIWTQLTGENPDQAGFDVKIVSPTKVPFTCVAGVPVAPHAALVDIEQADAVVVTDLAIDPEIDHGQRWGDLGSWLNQMHDAGAYICSVCSGSTLLASSGLLADKVATTHWGYVDYFQRFYPEIKLEPNRILIQPCGEDRVVTTGGMAAWEELALYLIALFYGEAAAIHATKVFLLGDRSEGQLVFAAMGKPKRHEDAVIDKSQHWIADHYDLPNPVKEMVAYSGLTERTFKRRFKIATGYSPIDYVQALRIEEAKQMLESTTDAIDVIAAQAGYEDPTSFRRLFKRLTGVTPGRYRQRFQSIKRVNG